MILLGIICIIVGAVLGIGLLALAGLILVLAGAFFWHGGRHYY